MSTHVIGFKPPDEEYRAKLEAWKALERAGVKKFPEELLQFFNWTTPDETGVEVQVPVREWSNDHASGYEVVIADLDPSIKILRFYNSW